MARLENQWLRRLGSVHYRGRDATLCSLTLPRAPCNCTERKRRGWRESRGEGGRKKSRGGGGRVEGKRGRRESRGEEGDKRGRRESRGDEGE